MHHKPIFATLALVASFLFTVSCGNHSFEEWLGLDSSSSEGEDYSSSSLDNISSSSKLGGSSSSSLQQSDDDHPGVVVGPLLKTKWSQGSPYNDLFPIENGERKVTDCVTTAMVQIMKFHKYPARGKGESALVGPGDIPVPLTSLNVAYDWDNMLNEYTSRNPGTEQQRLAVATLMYHFGLARSIALSGSSHKALVDNFGYDKSFQRLYRAYYSDAEWEAIIRQQLDLGLPVWYYGRSVANEDDDENYSTESKHGFVVDGYDNAGKFHINPGWGGSYEGWYSLNNIDLGNGRRYNYGNIMGINIKPDAGSIGSNEMGLDKFTTSKATVLKDEGFTVNIKIYSAGFFPGGKAGVALVNNSDNIVAVVGMINNYDAIGANYSRTSTINCSVPTTVNAGLYKLRIVTKMNDGEWKIVAHSLSYVPNAIPFAVTTEISHICPDASSIVSGTLTDSRDGKKYRTVKIGEQTLEQTWMAENLNYNVAGSKCYGEGGQVANEEGTALITLSNAEIQAYCDKYGRLYDWETAMKACPSGWHLPSNAEWDNMVYYVDIKCGKESKYETPYKSETAGKYLKAQDGWINNGNGTDNFGFTALPGGKGSYSGNFFSFVGEEGYWYSSSEYNEFNAYYREIYYKNDKVYSSGDKKTPYSVRCVKD